MPLTNETESVTVNRLRAMSSNCCDPLEPAPAMAPSWPLPTDPMLILPIGWLWTNDRLESSVGGAPVIIHFARVNPPRSVLITEELNVCVSDRKSTRLNSSHLGISYA